MTRFLLAVLIGVGLTLAWQSYGEEAKQIVGPWARDTLLPRWTAPQVDAAPKQTRSTPFGDITDAEVAKTSAALAQQLEAMARDLAMIRGSTEQLATKQQEMAQSIATLQANIEQKLGSPPVPPAVAMPPNAPRPLDDDDVATLAPAAIPAQPRTAAVTPLPRPRPALAAPGAVVPKPDVSEQPMSKPDEPAIEAPKAAEPPPVTAVAPVPRMVLPGAPAARPESAGESRGVALPTQPPARGTSRRRRPPCRRCSRSTEFTPPFRQAIGGMREDQPKRKR